MSIYTYVVDHETDDHLRFSKDTKINGGELLAVAYFDALERLEKMEEAVNLCLKMEGDLPPRAVQALKEVLS